MLVEHRGSFSSPHQKPKNQEEGGRGVIRVQTGEVDVSITKLPGPGSGCCVCIQVLLVP